MINTQPNLETKKTLGVRVEAGSSNRMAHGDLDQTDVDLMAAS